jgi:uncharacterized protein (DUF1015 family)
MSAERAGAALKTAPGITARPPRVLVADGGELQLLPVPSVVVYRVETDEHRQTGVLVEVAVDDYRRGLIRRHEATRPEQEREIARLTEVSGVERAPVTLAHPARPGLAAVVGETTARAPDLRVRWDGLTHTVWTCQDPRALRSVFAELGRLDALYIADGHHRMAAADRRAGGSAFTLAALFPSEQMRVLGYHRCLPRPRQSTSDILAALVEQPAVVGIQHHQQPPRPEPGVVAMVLDATWYRIQLRTLHESADERASLDVVQLDETVLPRISPEPPTAMSGGCAPDEVARRCDRSGSIGFLLHPPTVDQITAVADAGQVLPAKSTWFDPKTSAGLFLREIT